VKRFLALCLLWNVAPSYSLFVGLLSKETEHLDTRAFEHFYIRDLLADLRDKGVEQLKSLRTHPGNPGFDLNRAEHLVPNPRLVKLQMKQLICSNEDLAVLAIKFPKLQLVFTICIFLLSNLKLF